MKLFIDISGWTGAVFMLLSYGLLSFGKMKADTFPYQSMNIFASGCLLINTYYKMAYPSAVINLIWIFIAVFALARKLK